MEKMKQFDKVQKELKIDDYRRVGCRLVLGLFIFGGIIWFCIPYAELAWSEDDSVYVSIMGLVALGIYLYTDQYIRIGENQKREKLYDLLRYTPITRKELRKSRLKIMLRLVSRLTVVFLVIQIVMTLLIEKRVGVENFLYPVVSGMILAGIGALDVLTNVR